MLTKTLYAFWLIPISSLYVSGNFISTMSSDSGAPISIETAETVIESELMLAVSVAKDKESCPKFVVTDAVGKITVDVSGVNVAAVTSVSFDPRPIIFFNLPKKFDELACVSGADAPVLTASTFWLIFSLISAECELAA